jgi:arsenite/tail-anchored protein-transporting ATPase
LRLDLPFAEKGDLGLKKIGLEVVVRVGDQKRTIMLPPALAAYSASGARFDDGTLEISFEKRPEAAGSAGCAGEGVTDAH